VLLALSVVPFGAFTEVSQRDVLRRCTHWPAAAEVYAVVAPDAGRIRDDIAGLKRILAAPLKTENAL
jgi:hypothetical protein